MTRLLRTDPMNTALLLQRLVLALVIFPHGAQKLLGWFGGYGPTGTLAWFTGTMHLPWAVGVFAIAAEFFGPLLLIAGLGTRLAAVAISATMIGAVLTTHLQVGFFMNWFGALKGEGYEFHLLALGLGAPLAIWGGGRAAVDSWLERRAAALGARHVVPPAL